MLGVWIKASAIESVTFIVSPDLKEIKSWSNLSVAWGVTVSTTIVLVTEKGFKARS